MMKILFTSVGRRVELMQDFRNAASKRNIQLEIYGADISNTAPALQFCDKTIIVPRITNEEYIPTLLRVCRKESIDALIPTIDTDLFLWANNRLTFESYGTKFFISNPEKVRICRDKRHTADYFLSIGLKSPQSVDDFNEYKAGADSAEMLLRLIDGEELHYIDKAAEDGAVYSRFDQSIRVK